MDIIDKYVYLGLVLTEHLNYNITAKFVSQAASRALGVLIAKFKVLGGMPHHVYKKLYDSMVWPVIAYGVAILGTIKILLYRSCGKSRYDIFSQVQENTLQALL